MLFGPFAGVYYGWLPLGMICVDLILGGVCNVVSLAAIIIVFWHVTVID